MEELKKFEEIMAPDERQNSFVSINYETGEYRRLTLEDLYLTAESIELNDEVPEKVRSHFSTARNLLIYSWFYYPFNVTAQFLAFVSVEMALKEVFNIGKYQSFKCLVKRAVEEGLVKDEGFKHIQRTSQSQELPGKEGIIENVKLYVETLIEVMPSLRNELAHGSSMLHMNGATSVRICADFINQLFAGKTANQANSADA